MIRSLRFLAMIGAVIATQAVAQPSLISGTGASSSGQLSLTIGHDEQVTLVIHTAENCPICKVWRESASGLTVAKQLPQRWPHVDVILIERKSLYGSESESLYPTQLASLFEARKERYQLSPPVPLFEIVRAKQVVARQVGLQGWTEGILPALAQLEASRASVENAPSTAKP